MRIAVPKERHEGETRIAASPASIERFRKAGADVVVERGAGVLSSFTDSAYEAAGATIAPNFNMTVKNADVVLKITPPMQAEEGQDELSALHKGQIICGHMNSLGAPKAMEALAKAGLRVFALELAPRITRAQSMDVLSSQANLAGYRAVLEAAALMGRALPAMSTAAGRVRHAQAFVIGVGVAGLQAIATAKRMGAVVYATDVRAGIEEQVQSVGGRFIGVPIEDGPGEEGGYAHEVTQEFLKKQQRLVEEQCAKSDIVITTAQVPGKRAPLLVSEAAARAMPEGSVLVDLAADSGGNCALTQPGKIAKVSGVHIIGHRNLPAHIPESASQLLAMNLWNFLSPWLKVSKGADGKDGSLALAFDLEDDIVQGCLAVDGGKIVHPRILAAMGDTKPSVRPSSAAATTPAPGETSKTSKKNPAASAKKAGTRP